MPANDGQRFQQNPQVHDADRQLLARRCHPSTRIAEYLLEPLGLHAWPEPTRTANAFEPLGAAGTLASGLAGLQILDVDQARDDGRRDIV
jgi:hypothetical protein